jgi:uncharacterized membrane protein
MKTRSVVIAALAFIGMLDALYISLMRNSGPVPCHITHGCTDVLTSRYSVIAGIPISLFGLAFYFVVFTLAIFEYFGSRTLRLVFFPAGIALVVSGLLVGIQMFILKAFCEYCLLSASLVLGIFLATPRNA